MWGCELSSSATNQSTQSNPLVQALATAQQRPEKHIKQVLNCTRGIVFLGTPHHGSGLAHWAESLAKAIGVLKQTNAEILAVLKSDSEVLKRIQNSFHTMIRSRGQDRLAPIAITCFFEELPLPGVGTVSRISFPALSLSLSYFRLFHHILRSCPATFQ